MLASIKYPWRCIAFKEDINMSERFAKKWEQKRDEGNSVGKSIRETIQPPPPLKPH